MTHHPFWVLTTGVGEKKTALLLLLTLHPMEATGDRKPSHNLVFVEGTH